jgi:hypothetical protein
VGIAYLATYGISNLYFSLVAKVSVSVAIYFISLWLLHSTIFKEAVLFMVKKEIT